MPGPYIAPGWGQACPIATSRLVGAGHARPAALRNRINQSKRQKFTIDAKPTGSKLAPPTSTPSISVCAISVFTLSGLTLPP